MITCSIHMHIKIQNTYSTYDSAPVESRHIKVYAVAAMFVCLLCCPANIHSVLV